MTCCLWFAMIGSVILIVQSYICYWSPFSCFKCMIEWACLKCIVGFWMPLSWLIVVMEILAGCGDGDVCESDLNMIRMWFECDLDRIWDLKGDQSRDY